MSRLHMNSEYVLELNNVYHAGQVRALQHTEYIKIIIFIIII